MLLLFIFYISPTGVIPIKRKALESNPGDYRVVSLISVQAGWMRFY